MDKDDHPFRIGFLVHDVSRLRKTVFDKALRPIGVTRSQWWVLVNLSRQRGEGMMQTELAQLMDVGKVTLGGLIDRLESSGLVKREADPGDRRAKRVVMTPKGAKLVQKIRVTASVVNDQLHAGISRRDVEHAEAVLFKMKQRLIAMDAVPNAAGNPKLTESAATPTKVVRFARATSRRS